MKWHFTVPFKNINTSTVWVQSPELVWKKPSRKDFSYFSPLIKCTGVILSKHKSAHEETLGFDSIFQYSSVHLHVMFRNQCYLG